MNLDRDLQRRLLETLRETYPAPANGVKLINLLPGTEHDRHIRSPIIAANLAYLDEHGLVDAQIRISSDGGGRATFARAKITARGMDFLEEDGGLSAILGVVTVRLHADTVRDLLATRVQEDAGLSDQEKSGLLNTIKHLPETSLQEAARYLMVAGIRHLPDAMHWLQTLGSP